MLDAAAAVVLEQGAGKLTLDAVAVRAGASKGGVLYHFPSKEALLEALLDRVTSHNRVAYESTLAKTPVGPGRELKAYVTNSVREPDEDDHVSGALLAVLNSSPAMIGSVADYFTARFAAISRDVPFERAALVHLATEGLWLMELFQVSPLDAKQRNRVVKLLKQLAEGDSQALIRSLRE